MGDMIEIDFGPDYKGRTFYYALEARRDSTLGPGWYIYGRQAPTAYSVVKLVARPDVPARRHPHYNGRVRRGWHTRREALVALATVQAEAKKKLWQERGEYPGFSHQ